MPPTLPPNPPRFSSQNVISNSPHLGDAVVDLVEEVDREVGVLVHPPQVAAEGLEGHAVLDLDVWRKCDDGSSVAQWRSWDSRFR